MVGRFSKRALGGLLRFCTQSSPLGRGGGDCGGQRGGIRFCWVEIFLPSEILLRSCTQSSPLGRGGGGQILQGGANSFCIQLHHQLPICETGRPLLPWCVISVDIRSLAYKVPRIRSMQVCNHNMVDVSKRDLRCVQNKVRFKICLHLSFQNQHSFVP